MKKNYSFISLALIATSLLVSCNKDGLTTANVTGKYTAVSKTLILNEGNFGARNGSLDVYDWQTQKFISNVPGGTSLGDVCNDIKVYGSKIYISSNNSNQVLVLDKNTFKVVSKISVKQPRSLEVNKGKVYCTAYQHAYGELVVDLNGIVAVIDTTSLMLTKQISVGRQPEGLAIIGSKLYVANSGGYTERGLGYENTISVIDLDAQIKLRDFPVAINLNQLKASNTGFLYASTLGDYNTVQPNLYKIDVNTEKVIKDYKTAVSKFTLNSATNYLYYFTATNKVQGINLYNDSMLGNSIAPVGLTFANTLYGISVQPDTGDLYLTETDYADNNFVYCISQSGKLLWKNSGGKLPSSIAFIQ